MTMITIGISGHRFLAEKEKLLSGIDLALDVIEKAYPDSSFSLLSPLAEGADRLVVKRALEQKDIRLIVPLPLLLEDYLEDFSRLESRKEFNTLLAKADQVITLPPAPTRQEAYAAAGSYLLEHCDVILLIWDGKTSQGTGGTGEIAARAQQLNKPLAWIKAGNREPGTTTPTTLGPEQGRVIFRNFPRSGGAEQEG